MEAKSFSTIQKAKKCYICSKCGRPIPVGTEYRRVRTPKNGKLHTTTECVACPQVTISTPTANLTVIRKRESKDRRAQDVDDTTFFKYFYLPYVIIDVFFDYVDSLADQMALLRISELKPITRVFRRSREEFYKLRDRHMRRSSQDQQQRHMEFFQDAYAEELDNEFKLIKWTVQHKRKMLDKDWQYFISSVYMCMCIYKALKEYAKICDKVIENLWGESRHSLVPDVVSMVGQMLPACLGDCEGIITEQDNIASARRILNLINHTTFSGSFSRNN